MMLEKLGAMAPFNTTSVEGQKQTLMQRVQASLDDPSTKPPGPETLPSLPDIDKKPIFDAAATTREMARKWWCNDFLQTMIFGDEEKLGAKPEEY